MKNLSPAVAALIQTMGTEPVNILEVQWVTDGPYLKYGDKETADVAGTILSLSNLESVIKLDSQGQSQSISVTLDDVSGEIKDIINTIDIHGKTVRLLQWFEGLPLTEAFELYEGEINSPIVWSEGDRTLSFSVITKLADKEVGFSPEEGNFPFLIDRLVGKPWPMAFGIVQNVPAVRLQEIPTTQIAQDLGITDPSLSARIAELNQQIEALDDAVYVAGISSAATSSTRQSLCFQFGEGSRECTDALAREEVADSFFEQIQEARNSAVVERAGLVSQKSQQRLAANTTIDLINTSDFPDGPTVLTVGDTELSGELSGDTFTISASVLQNYDYGDRYDSESGDDNEPFGYTFIQAGTLITVTADVEILYIANIVDSDIKTVQTFRETENGPLLVTVSTSFYEVVKEVSGPYTFTIIKFARPLSSLDSSLSDDIFVTLESTVGPNTVDIMEWLIDTYTDLTYDSTTFDAVKIKLENYPSHFAMLERKNILTMLEEMAFQSRCAIWISNGIFYIKYLSEEATSIATITESDIDAGSLVMEATQTEELVTKLTATWTDNYANDDNHSLILRHNVKKYGTKERDVDFYIYNIAELVVKSATFWLIRLSNVWKNISFDTYVTNLALESFDTVLLDFAQDFVSSSDVKALVTDVTFNTSENLLNVKAWIPIRFGEMTQYDFSWPSQISIGLDFPTNNDILQEFAGGAGPGADVEPFTVKGQQQIVTIQDHRDAGSRDQRSDYGDQIPSDIDDTKPVPRFKGTPFVAGEDPGFQYVYGGKYGAVVGEVATEDFAGAVFPGLIIVLDDNSGTRQVYGVDVYTNGLNQDPERKLVEQLQGTNFDAIPLNSWALIVKNNQPVDGQTGIRPPGLNEDEFEWTMQVPVWL